MAQADWLTLTPNPGNIAKGVTGGIPRPNGGGSFIYAFNSLDDVDAAAGLYVDGAGFNPTGALKGGFMSCAMKRGQSSGSTGFSPFMFMQAATGTTSDIAYMIGLSDSDPYYVMMVKGIIANGIPDANPGAAGVVWKSNESFEYDEDKWLHIKMEVVVNGNSDVVLVPYMSDLDAHVVSNPVWTAMLGSTKFADDVSEFIDDNTQINTGSATLTSGKMGFGFVSSEVTRRAYFDHIVAAKQN